MGLGPLSSSRAQTTFSSGISKRLSSQLANSAVITLPNFCICAEPRQLCAKQRARPRRQKRISSISDYCFGFSSRMCLFRVQARCASKRVATWKATSAAIYPTRRLLLFQTCPKTFLRITRSWSKAVGQSVQRIDRLLGSFSVGSPQSTSRDPQYQQARPPK